MIDSIDLNILNIIQRNGKISNAELARTISMAPSGVLERVKKLEKKGIILAYEVRLNHKALGVSLATFIHIKTMDAVGSTEIGRRLAAIEEIQEVHWIAGEFNYLIKAKINGTDALTGLLRKIGTIQGVTDSRTTLVLDTLKEHQAIAAGQIEYKKKENVQADRM
jgi:Lrp/AsnC family transcriptional regulator, leucine-responsive regulatory protein